MSRPEAPARQPVPIPAGRGPAAAHGQPRPPRPLSVLVVEDQADLAASLALYLELRGEYRVAVAADGEAGLAVARADPPDAVVCDIGLPRMDGYAVARALAALPAKPLLIAVTGHGDPGAEGRGRAAGFDHYLLKPADPRAIEALLGACRAGPSG